MTGDARRWSLEPGQGVRCSVSVLPAAGGLSLGQLALDEADLAALEAGGAPAILVGDDFEAEDIPLIRRARGVVAVDGGLTGVAAIACRGLGRPCVLGGGRLTLERNDGRVLGLRVDGTTTLESGDTLAFDGHRGVLFAGVPELAGRAPTDPFGGTVWVAHPAEARAAALVGAGALALRPLTGCLDRVRAHAVGALDEQGLEKALAEHLERLASATELPIAQVELEVVSVLRFTRLPEARADELRALGQRAVARALGAAVSVDRPAPDEARHLLDRLDASIRGPGGTG